MSEATELMVEHELGICDEDCPWCKGGHDNGYEEEDDDD